MTFKLSVLNYVRLLLNWPNLQYHQFTTAKPFFTLLSLIYGHQQHQIKIINNFQNRLPTKIANLKQFVKLLHKIYKQKVNMELSMDKIDISKIARYGDEDEIMNGILIIMQIFLKCQNRDFFIGKILQLGGNEQEQLAQVIQEILNKEQNNTRQQQLRDDNILDKITQLQQQNNQLKRCLQNEQCENIKLKNTIKQLQQQVCGLQEQIRQCRQYNSNNNNNSNNSDDDLNHKQQQKQQIQRVISLQFYQKIQQIKKQHHKQIKKYIQQKTQYQSKISKFNQLQLCLQCYQQKITSLNKKISLFQTQKNQLNHQLTDKNNHVLYLQNQLKNLNYKISKLQFEKINMKIQTQKINIRSSQLQNQVRKKLSVSNNQIGSRTARSKLSQLCPQIQQDTYKLKSEQLQQQLQIATKRIKQLQRQLSKYKIKGQKLNKLEKDYKKLQDVYISQMNSKKQQIQILSGILYELRNSLKQNDKNKFQNRGFLTVLNKNI